MKERRKEEGREKGKEEGKEGREGGRKGNSSEMLLHLLIFIPYYYSLTHRVLLGTTRQDHHSFLSALRAASVARTPLSKVLDSHKQTEEYR